MDIPLISNVEDLSEGMERDSADDNDLCNAVLRYINDELMEDDLEDKVYMIQDSSLHAAEKSFYEVLNQKCPSSLNQRLPLEDKSSVSYDSITQCRGNFGNSYLNTFDSGESSNTGDSPMENFVNVDLTNQFSRDNRDSGNSYLGKNKLTHTKKKEKVLEVKRDLLQSSLTGRKSHREESVLEEGRSNKHLAVYPDESVLHEMFDKVLSLNDDSALNTSNSPLPKERAKGSNVELTYIHKGATKREAVDMRSLLTQCMESVAENNHKNANILLKQIRLRSSPSGDGSQRLAHYFANSLEARLAGSGRLEYGAFSTRTMSDSDILRAYKLYLSSFPFMGTSYFCSAEMIMEISEKATCIHIIHFGIIYGLQWIPLIQRLSTRTGGPPKLRITGIDLPESGFQPGARVKETRRQLANYCQRFNIPFEYNGIVQKWETINVEDLKIEKDQVLVVNCLQQLMFLLDDTVMEDSPRDAVLNLINRINPDIFIHRVANGNYNSPFFISRFREALFHYAAMFDMIDAIVPRDNQERMVLEGNIHGNEILNVVACEGLQRVLRPETYKQWKNRALRAGFRQLPLSKEMIKKVKDKVKSCYHKDFFVDEAGEWMLEGWKGRVIFALSCWKRA